jgi:hypothetical protein
MKVLTVMWINLFLKSATYRRYYKIPCILFHSLLSGDKKEHCFYKNNAKHAKAVLKLTHEDYNIRR